jgi:YHS domain-containing protein
MKKSVKDPVCGAEIDLEGCKRRISYRGIIYCFCSPECKSEFEKAPRKYAEKQKAELAPKQFVLAQ